MPHRYYYKNLKDLGYGCRNTIAGKVKKGLFPLPFEDESGRPIWFDEQLEAHDTELKQKQYVSTPISHLQKCEELKARGT